MTTAKDTEIAQLRLSLQKAEQSEKNAKKQLAVSDYWKNYIHSWYEESESKVEELKSQMAKVEEENNNVNGKNKLLQAQVTQLQQENASLRDKHVDYKRHLKELANED